MTARIIHVIKPQQGCVRKKKSNQSKCYIMIRFKKYSRLQVLRQKENTFPGGLTGLLVLVR